MSEALQLSIRIDLPGGGRFGPGKAALLKAIAETGSISAASSQLGMSYPRALKLVDEMNDQFRDPLVEKQHGGASRGGSQLTPAGARTLALYRSICEAARASALDDLERLSGLVATETA